MKPISRKAIKDYFNVTLQKSQIVEAVEEAHHTNSPKMLKDFMPGLYIDNDIKGFNAKAAGFASGCTQVHIAQWILADDTEAKGVVRHEIAHILQHYRHMQQVSLIGSLPTPHGKTFTSALKIVSPKTWRKDRHWRDSPNIEKARKECIENPNNIHLT